MRNIAQATAAVVFVVVYVGVAQREREARQRTEALAAEVALALHRTTLEALTNVRKHANAATVEIELAFRDHGLVQLRVHDDGKGAVEETVGTGFGLRRIRERAEQLKGHASYRMAPNEGFTLSVELPA